MKFCARFLLLAMTGSCFAAATSSYMESLNLAAYDTLGKFEKNLAAARSKKRSGILGAISGVFSGVRNMLPGGVDPTKIQSNLDELAVLFAALNYADVMTLDYLNEICQEGGGFVSKENDPILCNNYPAILTEVIEGRISTISTQYMSNEDLLKPPPEWTEHALEILKFMEDLSSKSGNPVNYSSERSLIKFAKDKAENIVAGDVVMEVPKNSPIEQMKRPFIINQTQMVPISPSQFMQSTIPQGRIIGISNPTIQHVPIMANQVGQMPMMPVMPMNQVSTQMLTGQPQVMAGQPNQFIMYPNNNQPIPLATSQNFNVLQPKQSEASTAQAQSSPLSPSFFKNTGAAVAGNGSFIAVQNPSYNQIPTTVSSESQTSPVTVSQVSGSDQVINPITKKTGQNELLIML